MSSSAAHAGDCDIQAYGFGSELDSHPLLRWMGDDWVSFVALELLSEFRKQDPGTDLLAVKCEVPPELQTRADERSGTVTEVALRLSLQVLLRDSSGSAWRLRGVGEFTGRGLAGDEPPSHAVSFEIETTERA